MSRSDCDSDGFESAEDDDFKEIKSSVANTKNPKDLKNQNVTTTKETETIDKFKALDMNKDDKNEDNDDWGWGDEDDDDDFKFDSKPNINETPKIDNQSTKPPEKHTEPTTNRVNEEQQNPIETPSSAWSPWSGMVSLLSTASTGVASLTSHVSSVIESNIGIPDPEKFAQQQHLEKSEIPTSTSQQSIENKQQQNDEKLLNLGSFVSNVTSISNRVISGGLDTLEGIGKKTMTILQENDAGLISKRKLLGLDNEKPVLSQVLREAKEKSEESEKTMKLTQKKLYRKQLHFETLFDDYHGLVHLEALEMLSKQASLKLQSLLMPLSGIALNELQQTMNSVSELCELNELDQDDSPSNLYDVTELEEKLKTATEDFDIPIDFNDILK